MTQTQRAISPETAILWIEPREVPTIDSDHLVEMFIRMGEAQARQSLACAIEEIGACVTECNIALYRGRFDQVVEAANRARQAAMDVGLRGSAHVAGHLIDCAEVGDLIASAAVLGRLARLGAAAAQQSWTLHDLSG